MLYARRQRQQEHGEQIARGEFIWEKVFDGAARNKLRYALIDAVPGEQSQARHDVCSVARHWLLRDEGLSTLTGWDDDYPRQDLLEYFGTCPHDVMPSLIESVGLAIKGLTPRFPNLDLDGYAEAVSTTLYEHGLGFDYVNGKIVERSSQELHEETVAPTLRLLAGRPEFEQAEVAYQNALREIGNDPADAITDAATALQETLKVLGATGNSLGAQLKSARSKGLIAPYDEKLVASVIEWTEADRSGKGDAHNARPASRHDAWLAVHVTGALIRCLVEGPRS